MKVLQTILQGARVFALDVGQGFFLITHSGLALLGLGVFCFMIIFSAKPDLRSNVEVELIDWLQTRHGLDFSFRPGDCGRPRRFAQRPSQYRFLAQPQIPCRPRTIECFGGRIFRTGRQEQNRPHPDLGGHGDRIQLQPLCPKWRRCARIDAGAHHGAQR